MTVEQGAKGVGWGWIIALFIFFFPAGVWLMIVKARREKENCLVNGKWISVLGWCILVCGAIYIIALCMGGVEEAEGGGLAIGLLLYCGGGAALIRYGGKYRKLGETYSKYRSAINRAPDGSLDQIAQECQKPYEEVCRELASLLNRGFFPGCSLDLNDRRLVFPAVEEEQYEEREAEEWPVEEGEEEETIRVVECPYCGAVNRIEGREGKCEYCGSPLV